MGICDCHRVKTAGVLRPVTYLDVEKYGWTHSMHEKSGMHMHCGSQLHCLRTIGDVAVEGKNYLRFGCLFNDVSIYHRIIIRSK